MAPLNKNNSATLIGFLLAVLSGLVLIDYATLTDFKFGRDWYKLAIPVAFQVKGWLTSFNEKSLNTKAKKGF
jgi:hypothetical protein